MAKLTLTDLASLENETSAITTINDNNAAIETALENTLSRDGTTPNTMGATLDMNSNRIINLPAPLAGSEPLRFDDLSQFLYDGPSLMIAADGGTAKNLILDESISITGVITPTALSASVNNYAPTGLSEASTIRLSSTGVFNITGIAAQENHQIYLWNIGSNDIILSDDDSASTDVNRFAIDGNLRITPDSGAMLWYDGTTNRWRSGSAGGGGSSSSGSTYNVKDYGAVGVGFVDDTQAIQDAINAAFTAGGGRVIIPEGEYGVGMTTETSSSNNFGTNYSLLLKDNVIVQGDGRGTHIKRIDEDSELVFSVKTVSRGQITNLFLDGNVTALPHPSVISTPQGILVESNTGTEETEIVLDTIWIEDTGGYGIGVEWGNHNGCTIKNIWTDGTGSDGIDIKRMNNGDFICKEIVLDNIHVKNFGLTTDDVAAGDQTGIDIRGYVMASNIWISGFGDQAITGIRFRVSGGDVGSGTVIGGHKSMLNNFFIECLTGEGYNDAPYGLEADASDINVTNGTIIGCNINLACRVADEARQTFTNIKSTDAVTYGYHVVDGVEDTVFIGCADNGSPVGFKLEGDRTRLIAPTAANNATTNIDIESTATGVVIVAPTFVGTITDAISNSGTNTTIIGSGTSNEDFLPGQLLVNGSFGAQGNIAISGSAPALSFTDTDSSGKAGLNANNGTGSLVLQADTQNALANSQIRLEVDQTNIAFVNSNGLVFGPTTTVNTSGSGTDIAQVQTTSANGIAEYVYSADAAGPVFAMCKSRNATLGSHTIAQNGDAVGEWRALGSNGTSFDRAGMIRFLVNGTPGATADMPGSFNVYTSGDGSNSPTLRMTVNSTGAVTFPTITTTASAANAFLDSGNSNTILRSTSSSRYKKDVEDLDLNYSKKLLEARPIYYRSKAKYDNPNHSYWGLLAEELAEIDPRLVHYGYKEEDYELVEENDSTVRKVKDGAEKVPDGVQYERLTVHLLALVQDLYKQIEMLKKND